MHYLFSYFIVLLSDVKSEGTSIEEGFKRCSNEMALNRRKILGCYNSSVYSTGKNHNKTYNHL